jgi:RimJ/RimL family protein N-acetyltransferase
VTADAPERVAYRVETARTVLRPPSPEHAEAVKRAEDASREHLRAFMPWADRPPETLDETMAKLAAFRAAFDGGADRMYLVFDRKGGSALGGTGLHPRVGKGGLEIGYWIRADRVRRGLATEIAGALTRVAFEVHDCRWVEIRCAASNVASAGVPGKLGFTHEATLRDRLEVPGGRIEDALVFTLLARDYASSAASRLEIAAFDAAGRKIF